MNLSAIEVESVSLKTILSPVVITVKPEDYVSKALKEMKQHAISCVVAVNDLAQPVGMFTEQDAINLMTEYKSISALKMNDVMSKPVLCARADMGYGAAYQMMSDHQVRHLVVVNEKKCIEGLVSEGDFLHYLGIEYLIELKTVQNSMTQDVVLVSKDAPITEALNLMSSKKISSVIATENNEPIGILTERDMVKLATEDSYDHLSVSDRMTSPLLTISPSAPLQEASQIMEDNCVRRLVVTDSSGCLKGILTRHDIAKSLQGSYIEYLQETLERKSRELRKTESRLRSIEKKYIYQDLVEQVSDAIYIIDAHTAEILDANEAASRGLKYDHDELVKLPITEISQLYTSLEDWLHTWIPHIKGKGDQWLITGHRCSDGTVLPVEVKARLVNYRQKDYVVAIARDISERLEATQRLKESQQRFQLLFENAPMAYLSLDLDGKIQAVNPAFLELLGIEGRGLFGRPIAEFLSPASQGTLLIEFPKFRLTKRISGPQLELIRSDGHVRYVQVSGLISKDELSGLERAHCILTDVTQQEKASRALKESAETYFGVITTALDGFFVADNEGHLLDVNESFTKMSGFSRDDLIGQNLVDIVKSPDIHILDRFEEIKQQGGQRFIVKYQKENGPIFDVEINATYWPGSGGRFFAFVRDVTVRKQRDDQLRQAAAVFANTTEGVMITDPQGKIQRVNRAFCKLTGYSEEEVLGQYPTILQSGRHDKKFYDEMWKQIAEKGYWQGEIWNRRKDGTTYPELLSINTVYDEDNNCEHYVGVFADITHLKESEQELAYLAHHDVLTGLPNRLMIQSHLEQALGAAQRDKKQLALLLLDLDRFKDVNDSFGHSAGDELLQQVSDVLRERLRQADFISRMGGDEFAILLDDVKFEADAGIVADDIIRHLSKRWHLSNGCEVAVGVSVGISLYPRHSLDAAALLQHADAALYRAKSEGRGRFNFFTEDLTHDARNRLELEAKLMRALTHNELEVYFQPQLEISSGEVVGAEALVRWNDPERGLVMPGDFIPVAEQTGLVSDIGEYVLKRSCLQLKQWLDKGFKPITLAVNLSPVQIRHADMYELVCSVLEETGLKSEYLELEITESALMEREQESIELLQKLRNLGVRVAIDDFGTGYSSLAYLKKFPLDVLKIDKSFVDDIPDDKDDMVIAATIVAMGQSLGIKVLAEGVETPAQLEFLKSKHCHCYQGYLFSQPVPANQFESFLR